MLPSRRYNLKKNDRTFVWRRTYAWLGFLLHRGGIDHPDGRGSTPRVRERGHGQRRMTVAVTTVAAQKLAREELWCRGVVKGAGSRGSRGRAYQRDTSDPLTGRMK